ncbi:unnamed protein product [Psylliodes chrysocephalus]|uniref:Uncharacterized protein n=1 Tax=Psylliodes chrysocephalus TaxID=3402493 RepID=A0A9P0D5U2_9CUCU|nr:unnamed protein product [Psylliodes chrysocephala]
MPKLFCKSNLLLRVDLLQMLEFNVTVTFPAAPLLTVILALVGDRKSKKIRIRQKQQIPCRVISSDKWVDIGEDKEKTKMKKEQEKKIPIEVIPEETSSEEECEDSGNSDDDDVFFWKGLCQEMNLQNQNILCLAVSF